MEMALRGTVLVSPAISDGEKEVIKAAQEANCKVIKLVENGFPEIWKPVGEDFYACARGELLIIAPWPYHSHQIVITKPQCEALNQLAADIANNE